MRIALVVATLGRPTIVAELLASVDRQTVRPDTIVLSTESAADLPGCLPQHVTVLAGPRGASTQRNRGLLHCRASHDVVVFLDDDYVPSRRFFENAARLFELHPDVVGATGLVLADGVGSGGIDHQEAERIVGEYDAKPEVCQAIANDERMYGCNMAFRCSHIGDILFDENLPLYSWQEDIDFAGQARQRGRLVRTNTLVGVHRGVTSGRTSGVKFGYSQIVNPIYLLRKGTMRLHHAAGLMGRNMIANHAGALDRSADVDRRGRVKGNWIGIIDVLRGDINPRRVLDL